jgi:hypothetical protein
MLVKEKKEMVLLPYEYIETEPYEKGFAEYYKEHIATLAVKYEPKRQQRKFGDVANIITAIAVGSGGVVLLVKSGLLNNAGRKGGRAIIFPPLLAWWFFVRRPRRRYFTALKEEVIPIILKFMGDFKYKPYGKVPDFLFKIHLIKTLFKFEDIITYIKNDVKFTISEQAFWGVYKYSGSIYLAIECKKTFDIDLFIASNKIKQFVDRQDLGIASGLKKAHNNFLKKRNFNTKSFSVNDRFNQAFELYTLEVVDERVVGWLSDDIINWLIALDNSFEGRGIQLSIKHNQILLILSNAQNSFEAANSYNECTFNARDTKKLLKELNSAINTLDFMEKIANQLPHIESQHRNIL